MNSSNQNQQDQTKARKVCSEDKSAGPLTKGYAQAPITKIISDGRLLKSESKSGFGQTAEHVRSLNDLMQTNKPVKVSCQR